MPKPDNIFQVSIPNTEGINASYSETLKDDMFEKTIQPAANVYDATVGTAFNEDQRNLMKASGLDEFDLIRIDGKSAREFFGYSAGASAQDLTDSAMKATIIGALTDANKKVEFMNVKDNGKGGIEFTPPTGVQAKLNYPEQQPRLGFWGTVRKWLGLPKLDIHKTNADRAMDLLDEKPAVREARHKEMQESIKSRAREVKTQLLAQEPFKKAVDDYEKVVGHNRSLYLGGERGKPISAEQEEAFKKEALLVGCDVRLNSRVAQMNLYMLHRGMTIDEVCSTAHEHDAKKIEYAKDWNKMVSYA